MNRCHSCLKETTQSFCTSCSKKLFGKANVSHELLFTRPEFNEIRLANSDKLSISGVQVKYSLNFKEKQLILTEQGGKYIIKPIPYGSFQKIEYIPANEHLTMQIANQIFNINTPPNALMLFKNKEPAYIVKRFDILDNGKKVLQEDFAQVANKTGENAGVNYKYDFSYEGIAQLMEKNIAAYPVEVEKFYSLVLFNFLTGNGDAHLKNFSVSRNEKFGDYTLTPAYDLVNTNLHIPNEAETALDLFEDGYITEAYKSGSKYTREDFYVFGKRIGIKESRTKFILDKFCGKEDAIKNLVANSFLSDELKSSYIEILTRRRERLKY